MDFLFGALFGASIVLILFPIRKLIAHIIKCYTIGSEQIRQPARKPYEKEPAPKAKSRKTPARKPKAATRK